MDAPTLLQTEAHVAVHHGYVEICVWDDDIGSSFLVWGGLALPLVSWVSLNKTLDFSEASSSI